MGCERLFIVSKSGGLIYSFDNQQQTLTSQPIEQTFSHPLPFKLGLVENKLVVEFECGETGGVKVGHVLLNYNQHEVNGQRLANDQNDNVLELLEKPESYPVSLRFGVPKITSNEKIILASTFHTVFAFACQLSPQV